LQKEEAIASESAYRTVSSEQDALTTTKKEERREAASEKVKRESELKQAYATCNEPIPARQNYRPVPLIARS